jgi:hypothetical protein
MRLAGGSKPASTERAVLLALEKSQVLTQELTDVGVRIRLRGFRPKRESRGEPMMAIFSVEM